MRPHASGCRRRCVPFHETTAAVQASTWYPLHSNLTCTPKFSRAAGVRQRWPTAPTALLMLQEMSRRVRLPEATIALQEWGERVASVGW